MSISLPDESLAGSSRCLQINEWISSQNFQLLTVVCCPYMFQKDQSLHPEQLLSSSTYLHHHKVLSKLVVKLRDLGLDGDWILNFLIGRPHAV